MNPIVVKFGGSSLATAAQFEKVAAIIRENPARRYVVASAPGKRFDGDTKVTDLLYRCYDAACAGQDPAPVLSEIRQRFADIVDALHLSVDLEPDFTAIEAHLRQSPQRDYMASRGEYLNSKLLAAYLGFRFVDAAQMVLFHADGSFDPDATNTAIGYTLVSIERAVVPGFYGAMPDGAVHTFTRGGSDVTGSVVARAVGAGLYENWTDVSGVLSADPRIIENPRRIDIVTYPELRELAYMGANVLHEGAIYPVKDAGIPINIRNTNQPDDPGTIICDEQSAPPAPEEPLITGLTGKKNFTVVTVSKNQQEDNLGIIRRTLEIFEKYRVEIEHIPSGIDSFSVVVSTEQVEGCIYDIVGEIRAVCRPADIRVIDSMALLAVVGRGMSYRPGVSGRLFAALGDANVNIRMIAQGSDELNIIVGVENKDFEHALRTVYHNFVQ